MTRNIGRVDAGRGREGGTEEKEGRLERKRNCPMAFQLQDRHLISAFAP